MKTLTIAVTTATLSNTHLAAILQLMEHVFDINGFFKRFSVNLSKLKVTIA